MHFLAARHPFREDARAMMNSDNSAAPHADAVIRTEPSDNGVVKAVQLTPTEGGQEACACGHPVAHHDATASRYCAATISGSLARGCVCAARPTASPEAVPAG
jgi:hypothetical protein